MEGAGGERWGRGLPLGELFQLRLRYEPEAAIIPCKEKVYRIAARKPTLQGWEQSAMLALKEIPRNVGCPASIKEAG